MDMILDELQDVSVLHSSVEACKVWGRHFQNSEYNCFGEREVFALNLIELALSGSEWRSFPSYDNPTENEVN